MQDYNTVAAPAESRFVEKKSRFLSFIAPASTEQEIQCFLSRIAQEHREASHVVYAYRLRQGQLTRYSDAGEPQGTAGMPTLKVLLCRDLTDAAIATVRYFGGTLLGTGGLTRAYSRAASDAVQAAQIVRRTYGSVYQIALPYSLYARVNALIHQNCFPLLDSAFLNEVRLRVFLPENCVDAFLEELTEVTAAAADTRKIEDRFLDIS